MAPAHSLDTAQDLLAEARRQLAVCNACRYCEGYCAMFPALERRSIVLEGDLAYLANLCHDCRACYQACMYAPPHEFGVSVPSLLSRARVHSYGRHARPRALAWALRHPSAAVLAATAAGLALALLAALASGGPGGLLGLHRGPGAFYAVVPYALMAVPALVVSALVAAVLGAGVAGFWRASGGPGRQLLDARLWMVAAREALTLRWLGGGGGGCHYPDSERASAGRRHLHGLVFFGFLAAFASTAIAALYQDVLGWQPPYPVVSAPVLLGAAGGVAMVAGCAGLLALKRRSPRALGDETMAGLDRAFLAVLGLAALTGLLTLALRGTRALGPALVLHLGVLAALYVTAPYGKFVHGAYRFAALLRDAGERRG